MARVVYSVADYSTVSLSDGHKELLFQHGAFIEERKATLRTSNFMLVDVISYVKLIPKDGTSPELVNEIAVQSGHEFIKRSVNAQDDFKILSQLASLSGFLFAGVRTLTHMQGSPNAYEYVQYIYVYAEGKLPTIIL